MTNQSSLSMSGVQSRFPLLSIVAIVASSQTNFVECRAPYVDGVKGAFCHDATFVRRRAKALFQPQSSPSSYGNSASCHFFSSLPDDGAPDNAESRHESIGSDAALPASTSAFHISTANPSRRSFMHSATLSFAGSVSSGPLASILRPLLSIDSTNDNRHLNSNVANAMGLVQFPCPSGTLMNTYHMMRAGESGLEAKDVLSTNPLFLTNREDALTNMGMMQVEEACSEMMSKGINPSVVKYSLASKCIDTANIVASKMMVGRNRIVPEFTFMDPRGAGLWDGKPLQSTEAAIWALDFTEAGKEGRGARPPPNDDGTPNETLFEQVTRLRQLMSILETQYSGDSILLIFPDGTSPALLSCLIAGIPLNRVHELNYSPGEVRLAVDMDSSLNLLKEKSSSAASTKYNSALSAGKEELVRLQNEELVEEVQPKVAVVSTPSKVSSEASETAIKRKTKLQTSLEYEDRPMPDLVSAGAMGLIGYMAFWREGKDSTEDGTSTNNNKVDIDQGSMSNLAFANATGMSGFDSIGTLTLPERNSSTTFNTVSTLVADVDLELGANVFVDVPVLTKEERVAAANKAMDDYLNQDDGGDAWLDSMKDILNED